MKIAVCFSGQARAVEYTHDNIQTHLLDELGDVDTFFNVCDDSDAYKIEKYFNPTALQIENEYVQKSLCFPWSNLCLRCHSLSDYLMFRSYLSRWRN